MPDLYQCLAQEPVGIGRYGGQLLERVLLAPINVGAEVRPQKRLLLQSTLIMAAADMPLDYSVASFISMGIFAKVRHTLVATQVIGMVKFS